MATTSSEQTAREGINKLVLERDSARAEIGHYKRVAEQAAKRVRELEDQHYGRMASTLTSYFDVSREPSHALRAQVFRIEPKSVAFMVHDDRLLDCRASYAEVEKWIEEVTKRHTEEITSMLRKLMVQATSRR